MRFSVGDDARIAGVNPYPVRVQGLGIATLYTNRDVRINLVSAL